MINIIIKVLFHLRQKQYINFIIIISFRYSLGISYIYIHGNVIRQLKFGLITDTKII